MGSAEHSSALVGGNRLSNADQVSSYTPFRSAVADCYITSNSHLILGRGISSPKHSFYITK